MNWKYHILHDWPEPRQYWEDIFLLPDTPVYTDEAIWLTIDALGDVDHPESRNLSQEELDDMSEKLGEEDYWIEGNDMIARAVDFDMAELLGWVRVWIEATGLQVDELIRAPVEDFRGRCAQVDLIEYLLEKHGGGFTD